MLTLEWVESFWSREIVVANLVVFANLLGALLLGLVVGYERSYHGRAAGMRTYGIVCMASAALVVFLGYPQFWFGGHLQSIAPVDPTRVIQGVVTGIGFLGAGVIMKEGLNISGLTTAASIWASSAIGILVGVGLYGAAMLLTGLSASLMIWGSRLEARLPSRHALFVTLSFDPAAAPDLDAVDRWLGESAHAIARGSVSAEATSDEVSWTFVAVAASSQAGPSVPAMTQSLRGRPGVRQVRVAHARN